jgi:hypothetical protein
VESPGASVNKGGMEWPRVCFKSLDRKDGAQLAQALADRLRGTVRVADVKSWPAAVWALNLLVGEKPFMAGIRRSKKNQDEWVLTLATADRFPNLLKLFGLHEADAPSPELMQACRSIHAVLLGSADISAVRWYFERPKTQRTAVRSPDELPWRRA